MASHYRLSKSIDLDALIVSAISELCDPDKCLEAANFEDNLSRCNSQIKSVERKQRDVSRILSDCETQIENCKVALEEADREEQIKYNEVKEVAAVAAGQPSEITIVDTSEEEEEDDDDVQFIQKTFDPDLAIRKQGQKITQQQKKNQQHQSVQKQEEEQSQPVSQSQSKTSTLDSLRAALSASINKNLGHPPALLPKATSTPPQVRSPSNPIQSARARFQATINKQLGIPNSQAISLSSQVNPSSQTPPTQQAPPPLMKRPATANPGQSSYSVNLGTTRERMEQGFLADVNKITEGCAILGKKYSDVWERGTLIEIANKSQDVSQRRYKVRFDNKKVSKQLTPKQVAFASNINRPVTVGTRIVALYKDDETDNAFYSGIIAEAPNGRNQLRYLVFFDDGYAQYCSSGDIHKVFEQSVQVWEDIHPDSQEFTRVYLAQYPERPMVRLHKGQTVKTEWKGSWWTAKVIEVDASLVQMYFAADKRSEWIYRGSTRLEPLYTALSNAEANRNAGKGKRHNLMASGTKKPVVEYTRNNSEDANKSKGLDQQKKKRPVAKKSCTGRLSADEKQPVTAEKPKPQSQVKADSQRSTSTNSSNSSNRSNKKDMASVLQERLAGAEDSRDEDSLGERCDQVLPVKDRISKSFVDHNCGPGCLDAGIDNDSKFKGNNPLLIPIYCGWERHVAKAKPYGKRSVFYRAPCSRRLRSIEELDKYLLLTDSQLTIDFFSFDSELHVHYEFIPVKTFCDIKDISYGKENVAISCVNGIDRQYPDYVDYSNQRIPASGVKLNLDQEFLVGCDCTDGCRDKSKCKCQQLTVEASAVVSGGTPIPDVGYKHRRLREPVLSGIYECNSRCKCDKRCVNRVVQNGLRNRLQVFKTEKRGWGLRCLDDIPHGGFICIYAGQLLTDQGANEDGQQYGDEYLAELDYIEVVERQKEGYESDVEELSSSEEEEEESEEERDDESNDSSFCEDIPTTGLPAKQHSTRSKKMKRDSDKSTAAWVNDVDSGDMDDLPDLDVPPPPTNTKQKSSTRQPSPTDVSKSKKRTGRSTGARYGNLNPAKTNMDDKDETKSSGEHRPGTRSYFNDSQSCYIMDAKSMGNIGRYLNHSCNPCAFVQNVFVDVHDLRFPWVAFFAGQYISAGTELTWDYNYEVGSVPNKVLYCYCGSPDCRGRLL